MIFGFLVLLLPRKDIVCDADCLYGPIQLSFGAKVVLSQLADPVSDILKFPVLLSLVQMGVELVGRVLALLLYLLYLLDGTTVKRDCLNTRKLWSEYSRASGYLSFLLARLQHFQLLSTDSNCIGNFNIIWFRLGPILVIGNVRYLG